MHTCVLRILFFISALGFQCPLWSGFTNECRVKKVGQAEDGGNVRVRVGERPGVAKVVLGCFFSGSHCLVKVLGRDACAEQLIFTDTPGEGLR